MKKWHVKFDNGYTHARRMTLWEYVKEKCKKIVEWYRDD